MRIVIAPDKFAGTLSAVEAAQAVADGWKQTDPAAQCEVLPLSDGGPGFVEVLHTAVGGRVHTIEATGPRGLPVTADYLLDTATGTAYVESAQACGLHLIPESERDPTLTTTRGVGELIGHAVRNGARTVVVGLGGSSTNDAGAGLLAALGAGPDEHLARGGAALAEPVDGIDLEPARRALDGVRLVAATDVDNPLLGIHGATAVFGPQKGADADTVQRLDAALTAFADRLDPERTVRSAPGAGAAGGLGFAMLLLGADVESGVQRVLTAVGLADRIADADLVVTGEGSFDSQSLRGKLPHGVARVANGNAVPCVVLAGAVQVGRAEAAAAGITETYSLVESAGSVEAAMARSGEELRSLAAGVARRWSRSHGPSAEHA